MAKLSIKPDSTSVSLLLFIQDSSSTVGAGKTGLAYNTASLTCYRVRPGEAAAAISLVTQTVTGAWSSGGFAEVDATNMPGVYRLDVPNAVLAASARSAVVMLKGASGMASLVLEIDLDSQVDIAMLKGSLNTATNLTSFFDNTGFSASASLIGHAGEVDGNVGGDISGNVNGSVASIAANGIDAGAFTTAAVNAIADTVLKRDWTAITGEASRSLLNAMRFLRNKWSISGTTLTVTKEDDATTAWTATLSTDAAADPVTGSDPA